MKEVGGCNIGSEDLRGITMVLTMVTMPKTITTTATTITMATIMTSRGPHAQNSDPCSDARRPGRRARSA
eukprot:9438350-Pyramimonas_sp.AAC.1